MPTLGRGPKSDDNSNLDKRIVMFTVYTWHILYSLRFDNRRPCWTLKPDRKNAADMSPRDMLKVFFLLKRLGTRLSGVASQIKE